MTVLTVDLGTSATKAALWSATGLVELVRVPLQSSHPAPDRAEQNPHDWWRSVVESCAILRAKAPAAYARVEVLGCAAARETFALFDRRLQPLGPGILWSDTRAVHEAQQLGDPAEFRRITGVALGSGCCAAKVAWVRAREPARFAEAAWILAPRDFVLARLTGTPRTDRTLASRTGFYGLDGAFLGDEALAQRLPPVVSSTELVAALASDELQLPRSVRVILGAGDRTCEALGVGASAQAPMVSWGTTANVSVPHPGPVAALPSHAQVSVGAAGDFLVEAGLSAAGSALTWLETLTGRARHDLLAAAALVPAGANGALAFPWLQGARAPWWQPDVRAAFVGIGAAHGAPELTRAVIEGVAFDTARCIDLVAPGATELVATGRGATDPLWRSILAAVASRPVVRRSVDDGASVGARLLISVAREERTAVDELNPVVGRETPDPELAAVYPRFRERSDRAAAALLEDSAFCDLPAGLGDGS